MFRHYFNISTRILLKQKFYSIINILGLAVGMGVCLLIFQYIQFELSFDQFHQNASNIYRLTQTAIRNGEIIAKGVDVTYGLGSEVQKSIPEVDEMVRIREQNTGLIFINTENDIRFQENSLWYVDKNFLQMFNFPMEVGDRKTALNDEHSMVLTRQMATKYFGTANPVGKVIKISGGSLSGEFEVKGVLKPLPENTHLQFDFLLPMEFILSHWRMYREGDGWTWEDFVTYVTINNSAGLPSVTEKLDQVVKSHLGEQLKKTGLVIESGLQPLADVHLKSDQLSGENADNNGDIQNVWLFSVIAVFILLIAWMNYINLSTALAMQRAKEVGVRKSMGAFNSQLIGQFLTESFLINLVAAVLAIVIAFCVLPMLNQITGKDLHLALLQNFKFWIWFVVVIILGAMVYGAFPAFNVSSFGPISAFKSGFIPQRNYTLRRSLIVFQFMISVILISGTYLVYKQVNFMKSQDLGLDIEKILVINGPRVILEKKNINRNSLNETFKTEVLRHHSISAISGSSEVPGKGFSWSISVRKAYNPVQANPQQNGFFVDPDFIKTYDLDFLAERKVPEEFSNYQWAYINEETQKAFGFESPESALDQEIILLNQDTVRIAGVVNNVHWSSLKDAYSPFMFVLDHDCAAYFSIKMDLTNVQETISYIASVYHSVYQDDPFHFFFLEEDFNRQYQADLQFGNLFSAFSLLAIFIACIGLFALVSFSATLRIKEIGIRKVLGASVSHLMMLLSREYLILLFIAILLAVPAIVIGGKAWLENYAYKVGIGFDLLLIPGLISLVIALVTVSYRTFAAASANPVESLRTE